MEKNGFEIERKYIIEMPDVSVLASLPDHSASDIEQIYLTAEQGVTRRIRRREYSDGARYYVTEKRRIDKLTANEHEWEISAEEYDLLRGERDPRTRPIIKRRHTFTYLGQLFEIDVYPEWERTAIMETELDFPEKSVEMPNFIRVIREVTGVAGYSNADMSHTFPKEEKTL